VEGRGHRSVEHTADLAVELWASDEPALLVEGARALVGARIEGLHRAHGGPAVFGAVKLVAGAAPGHRLIQYM
jgi:hypothetical protein